MTDVKVIASKFEDHVEANRKDFKRIYDTLSTIKNNHLKHLEDKVVKIERRVERVQTDVKWIKLIGGVLILESLGVLIKLVFG